MKRLGIFVFYDKEGIVDRYVEYLITEMNRVLDSLVIVCNGYVNEEGIQKLSKYSKDIYMHENLGFDAGAYKYILIEKNYITHLCEYDELVLFNDTCYGPIYPMGEIFQKMESRNVDFWGMTQYEDHMIKKHVQSYFLVFDKAVMESKCFSDFWMECDTNTTNVGSIITDFEIQITQTLVEGGFNWSTFVDPTKYNGLNSYQYFTDQLIENDYFPFLKKKRFTYKTLNKSVDRDLAIAMKYIDESTSYPIELIYENAIRLYDIFDLRETLNLNYVVTHDMNLYAQKEYNAAVFIYLKYENILDEVTKYIKEIPKYMKVYIVSAIPTILGAMQDKLKDVSNSINYLDFNKTNNDTVQFISKISGDVVKYEYCCFINDLDVKQDAFTRDTQLIVWDNLLKNKEYIENVLAILEQNKFLGVLTVPYFYHGDYISSFYNNGANMINESVKEGIKNTGKMLSDMGLRNHVNMVNIPISTIPSFWCRTKSLYQLFETGMKDDFVKDTTISNKDEVLNVIAPYFAQANGYYTGQVENTEFAALTLINYENIIRKLMINKEYVQDDSGENNSDRNNEEILHNISDNEEIYIYGTGLFGNITLRKVKGKNVKGFIVSDAYYRDKELKGIPIYKLSDVQDSEDKVIIVGMDRKNTEDIKPMLKRFKNVVYLW